jgi:hypothetical protein
VAARDAATTAGGTPALHRGIVSSLRCSLLHAFCFAIVTRRYAAVVSFGQNVAMLGRYSPIVLVEPRIANLSGTPDDAGAPGGSPR